MFHEGFLDEISNMEIEETPKQYSANPFSMIKSLAGNIGSVM